MQELIDTGLLVAGLACLVGLIVWLAWTGRWRDPLADAPFSTSGPGVLSICVALLALMSLYLWLAYTILPPSSTGAVTGPGSDAFHRDQCAFQVAELLVSALMIVLLRPNDARVVALRQLGARLLPPTGASADRQRGAADNETAESVAVDQPHRGAAQLSYARQLARPAAIGQRHLSAPVGMVVALVGLLILLPIATAQWALGELIWRSFHAGAPLPTHLVLLALRDTVWGKWGQAQLVAGAVIFTPIAEELFFRGLVLGAFLRHLKHGWLAILAGAAVFGFVHLSQPQTVLPLVTMGLVLGFIRIRCGAVWPCMVLHGLFNARTMLTALAAPELV